MKEMLVARRIRELRKVQGLSQEALGGVLHVKGSYISQIEAGKKLPSDAFLDLVMRKFNISEDWWETGEGEMQTKKEPPKNDLVRLAESEFEKLLEMMDDDAERLQATSELLQFLAEQRRKRHKPSA